MCMLFFCTKLFMTQMTFTIHLHFFDCKCDAIKSDFEFLDSIRKGTAVNIDKKISFHINCI